MAGRPVEARRRSCLRHHTVIGSSGQNVRPFEPAFGWRVFLQQSQGAKLFSAAHLASRARHQRCPGVCCSYVIHSVAAMGLLHNPAIGLLRNTLSAQPVFWSSLVGFGSSLLLRAGQTDYWCVLQLCSRPVICYMFDECVHDARWCQHLLVHVPRLCLVQGLAALLFACPLLVVLKTTICRPEVWTVTLVWPAEFPPAA